MHASFNTVIVGGGQAGLSIGYYLGKFGVENVILEKAERPANAWRNDRWDSFTLLTPNWSFLLPGSGYDGAFPDGFMPREEILRRFEDYIRSENLPISYDVRVEAVDVVENGYRITTNQGIIRSANVVIATGLFQTPKKPLYADDLSLTLYQVTAARYRQPRELPEGAVLVVGTAQSGCQIAEELYLAGRRVFLSTSGVGRVPRRYRGKDIYEWMQLTGWLDRTPDQLASPKEKFIGNPHVTGKDGGRTLNLHKFARDGVILLGHIRGAAGNRIWMHPDRNENLAKADRVESDLVNRIDKFIVQTGLPYSTEELPILKDGFSGEELLELNLESAGVTSVVWATGFSFDFSMVHLPVLDGDGFPVQSRGVTNYPGLFFIGMPWISKYKSGHLFGVAEDAQYLASVIAAHPTR